MRFSSINYVMFKDLAQEVRTPSIIANRITKSKSNDSEDDVEVWFSYSLVISSLISLQISVLGYGDGWWGEQYYKNKAKEITNTYTQSRRYRQRRKRSRLEKNTFSKTLDFFE